MKYFYLALTVPTLIIGFIVGVLALLFFGMSVLLMDKAYHEKNSYYRQSTKQNRLRKVF